MSQSNWELWALIIVIAEFDINYYIYSTTESILNLLIVIVSSVIIALGFILFHIYSKMNDLDNVQNETDKKLKMYKELEDIRLDLRELKRKVFKNE